MIAALVASIVAALLIARPHVERYYALVGCSRTEKCWTEKGWYLRGSPADEFPNFHSCNEEISRIEGDHPSMDFVWLCGERYRLEWGYRD